MQSEVLKGVALAVDMAGTVRTIEVVLCGIHENALSDSGATSSFLTLSLMEEAGSTPTELNRGL